MRALLSMLCLAVLAGTAGAAGRSATSSGTAGGAAPGSGRPDSSAVVRAIRAETPPTVDGALTEPVWQEGIAFTTLFQRDPTEGAPPSQRTEIRVAYDDEALYVGARLLDTAPDSVVARLARRDASIASDRFAVYLDPYYDRRSGYYFMVNAAGTLYDGTLANDVEEDKSWDGVWEGSARTDPSGWTVEMKIPYSQLRIARSDRSVWGVNFLREIPRRREKAFAAYRPRKESGFVSRFPDLVGIQGVSAGGALEIMPYVTAQGEYLDHDAGDPFNDGSRTRWNGGGDLRAGVGAGMTLNATVNPDFGQVEIDPARVNLTDVEDFFEEKRPFFVEGASTFAFGRQGAGDYWDSDWEDPLFFYSRRIGRTPQGRTPSSDFADVPVAVRILGAAKLIGRTSPRATLGTLHAVTRREVASLEKDGRSWEAEIEPLTYYGVARTQRESGGRRSGIGFLGTATARAFDDPRLRDQLNSFSLLGGIDGWHFLDRRRTWVLSGWSGLSHVAGNSTRMIALQRNSTHYHQRPDARHVEVDSSATSLTGAAARLWLNKDRGAWLFNAAAGFVNPGFEVNDLGFQTRSDMMNGHVGTGWKWTRGTSFFRYQTLKASVFGTMDLGGHAIGQGLEASGYTEFHNGHTLNYYGTFEGETYDNRRTRGGPIMIRPRSTSFSVEYLTDTQRRSYYYIYADGYAGQSGSWGAFIYPGMEWKPSAAFSLKITPGWERVYEDAQFVTSFSSASSPTYGRRYVFATLEQETISASFRINWTFTPRLSLETYTQPFVSTGDYSGFKTLDAPASYEFTPVTWPDTQDFTVRSLKGNAVLRWEYRPGSALFLVWTQKRSESETFAGSLRPDLLGNPPPENVLLAKLTYYFTR